MGAPGSHCKQIVMRALNGPSLVESAIAADNGNGQSFLEQIGVTIPSG